MTDELNMGIKRTRLAANPSAKAKSAKQLERIAYKKLQEYYAVSRAQNRARLLEMNKKTAEKMLGEMKKQIRRQDFEGAAKTRDKLKKLEQEIIALGRPEKHTKRAPAK